MRRALLVLLWLLLVLAILPALAAEGSVRLSSQDVCVTGAPPPEGSLSLTVCGYWLGGPWSPPTHWPLEEEAGVWAVVWGESYAISGTLTAGRVFLPVPSGGPYQLALGLSPEEEFRYGYLFPDPPLWQGVEAGGVYTAGLRAWRAPTPTPWPTDTPSPTPTATVPSPTATPTATEAPTPTPTESLACFQGQVLGEEEGIAGRWTLSGVRLMFWPHPWRGIYRDPLAEVTSGRDGRFEVCGLEVGRRYHGEVNPLPLGFRGLLGTGSRTGFEFALVDVQGQLVLQRFDVGDPTPRRWSGELVLIRPSSLPTLTPTPRAVPTVPPDLVPVVCWGVLNRVPPVVVADALANPHRVYGWGMLADPGKPRGPANEYRRALSVLNPAVPYHPQFNGVVYKAGCP